ALEEVEQLVAREEVEVVLALEEAPLAHATPELGEHALLLQRLAIEEVALVVAELEEAVRVVEHRLEDLRLEAAERLRAQVRDDRGGRGFAPRDQLALDLLRPALVPCRVEGPERAIVERGILDAARGIDVAILMPAVTVRAEKRLVLLEERPALVERAERREEGCVALLAHAGRQARRAPDLL